MWTVWIWVFWILGVTLIPFIKSSFYKRYVRQIRWKIFFWVMGLFPWSYHLSLWILKSQGKFWTVSDYVSYLEYSLLGTGALLWKALLLIVWIGVYTFGIPPVVYFLNRREEEKRKARIEEEQKKEEKRKQRKRKKLLFKLPGEIRSQVEKKKIVKISEIPRGTFKNNPLLSDDDIVNCVHELREDGFRVAVDRGFIVSLDYVEEEIIKLLNAYRGVTLDFLARNIKVSKRTVRKILEELVSQEKIPFVINPETETLEPRIPPQAGKGIKVFLCHSSKDKGFVRRLAQDLEGRGVRVWFDEWEMKVGDSLADRIQEGIEHSSYLAVVLSPNSVKSGWVKRELNAALAKELKKQDVFILPILYKDCEIPLFLQDKIYADFRQNYTKGLRELMRRFEENFKKPSPTVNLEISKSKFDLENFNEKHHKTKKQAKNPQKQHTKKNIPKNKFPKYYKKEEPSK